MDLRLEPDAHDILFVNGETPVTQLTSEVVAQRLKITLFTFWGEWFLNRNIGVPYYQQIFGKVRRKSTIDTIMQGIIYDDPDVIEILTFTSDLDAHRKYTMTFTVRVSDNTESLPITIDIGG
ncbi:hypothetical protein D3C79_558580 [compost metagenome]